jgi:hypothetical protein
MREEEEFHILGRKGKGGIDLAGLLPRSLEEAAFEEKGVRSSPNQIQRTGDDPCPAQKLEPNGC